MTIHQDPELVMTLQSVIEFIGTFAFALSGIRLAASKHYDWLGGFLLQKNDSITGWLPAGEKDSRTARRSDGFAILPVGGSRSDGFAIRR